MTLSIVHPPAPPPDPYDRANFHQKWDAVMVACAPLRARLTLKGFREIKALSEETRCFSATLLLDGKLIADASNRGHGGPTEVHFRSTETEDAAMAAFKTLAGDKPVVGFDSFIDDIVSEHAEQADWLKFAARWNKKGWTCIRIKGEGYGRINTRNAVEVAAYSKQMTSKGKTVTATL